MSDVLLHKLSRGLDALGVEINPRGKKTLVKYVLELEKWNSAYNLTAVREPEQMITRHILDSLSILPLLHGSQILDVGSGAGFPGLPLAVAEPDSFFTLLDSNGKKTRFLTQVVADLELENIDIVQERVEKFHPTEKFDTLTSRAFSSLAELVKAVKHLCAPGSRIIAMKGVFPESELKELPKGFKVIGVESLSVPDLDEDRHAIIIERTSA
ncbi:MAG: 16S rRNA (guanine(527)-N(7))-methyltransferase RsmG [Gammaproteobacteria bacterium]|nr:16S rRNA (guanine(527)-N(7))-methyltransferase RsmG [Gammaproteobacteria bacterium]